jgi:uncharacterized protein YggE
MKRWIVPVAGGGVAAALLAVGVLAAVHDGPTTATAQVPTTVPGSTVSATPGAPRTVTVDGVGVVTGIPDTVTVNLGVSVDRGSAADALQAVNSKANALIETLTGAGVAKADIQTGYISVWPHYDNRSTPDGYSASNSVTAVIHDVSRAGPVIDAATDAVGDGITLGGVSFSIDDTSDLYGQARQKAVAEAKTRAGQLAQAAGVSVGTVLSMNESTQAQPSPYAYDRASGAATTVAGSAPTPIEPGHQELQLRVQVVFELVG